MERLQIEERFLANFEAVSSEGNESYESLRSVSSYDSELVMSDFTMSLTPSPNTCGRNSDCSSLSGMLYESESENLLNGLGSGSEGGDRVGSCYSDLSGESDTYHQKNPFTFKKVIGKKRKQNFKSTCFRFMKITSVLRHLGKNPIPKEKHLEKHESPVKV